MASSHRTLLVDALTLATPLALVLGVRVFFAPAPTAPSAAAAVSHQTSTPLPAPVAPAKLAPEQQKAADWLAALPSPKGVASPLDHPVPAAPPPQAEPQTQVTVPTLDPSPEPELDPLQGLKLTAILGNANGGLAAINGRVYKAGDLVRTGLHLKRIDAKTSTVIFSRDDGSELRLCRPPQ